DVYTRLFGPGPSNVYQFDDAEMREVDRSSGDAIRTAFTFHGVRMYQDAARFLTFKRTGAFPAATDRRGLASLEEVLGQDARFPASRDELLKDQGWKVFDLDDKTRAHAAMFLERLPEKVYADLTEALSDLRAVSIGFEPTPQGHSERPPEAWIGTKTRPGDSVVALTRIRLLWSREMSRESKRKINVSLWNGLRERRRSKHVPRVAARQRHGCHAIEAAEGASPPDGISLPGMPERHPRHALHRRWRPQDEEDLQGARRIRRGVLVRRGNVPPRGELGLRRRRPREP